METNSIPQAIQRQAARALIARGLDPQYYFPFLSGDAQELARGSLEATYLDSRSLHQRRTWGQYHTPPWLVAILLNWLEWPSGDALLDPACGTGAFLVPAARRLADACLARGWGVEETLRCVEGSLVGYDVDPLALFISSLNLHVALADLLKKSQSRPGWRLHVADFLTLETGLEHHGVIVGNPPWGVKVSSGTQKTFREPGESAFMFLEAALDLLSPGQSCALVLPDTILLKHYPAIRRMVLSRTRILNLALLGKVFPGANVEAVALHLVGSEGVGAHSVRIWQKARHGLEKRAPVEQRVFGSLPDYRFNVLMSKRGLEMSRRLRQGKVPLASSYRVHEGIHSGNVRRKLFVRDCPGEKGRRLLLRGSELQPFQCNWNRHYVNYDPSLIQRAQGEYASLGRSGELASPKVLVRRTGEKLTAAFDEQGLFISNNFFYCLPRSNQSLSPKVLVCLLNSALLRGLYHLENPVMGRMFAELKIMHLSALPVPDIECERLKVVEPRLTALHDEMVKTGFRGLPREEMEELVMYLYAVAAGDYSALQEHLGELKMQQPPAGVRRGRK